MRLLWKIVAIGSLLGVLTLIIPDQKVIKIADPTQSNTATADPAQTPSFLDTFQTAVTEATPVTLSSEELALQAVEIQSYSDPNALWKKLESGEFNNKPTERVAILRLLSFYSDEKDRLNNAANYEMRQPIIHEDEVHGETPSFASMMAPLRAQSIYLNTQYSPEMALQETADAIDSHVNPNIKQMMALTFLAHHPEKIQNLAALTKSHDIGEMQKEIEMVLAARVPAGFTAENAQPGEVDTPVMVPE